MLYVPAMCRPVLVSYRYMLVEFTVLGFSGVLNCKSTNPFVPTYVPFPGENTCTVGVAVLGSAATKK
jgi:hypothetical protein